MPSVVQTQTIASGSFMLRERPSEPAASGFTAVNGRSSPPEPRTLHRTNGMTADSIHVRPHSQNHSPQVDQKVSLPGRDDWPTSRPSENGAQNSHPSVSPQLHTRDTSPHSPGKRKRSTSAEDFSSYHSPSAESVQSRRRLDSYASAGRDDSPQSVSHGRPVMEQSQPRTLPPMDRSEHDRNWPPHESQSQERSHNAAYPGGSYRDARAADASQDPNSAGSNGMNDSERSSTTEITRAGVQVDPKKRKRQFANRTKTGCGTCRRRKKKCDEAKPECNNCMRGGFICEGYANKVPWPKNGITKPHPPLQAKDRYPVDPAQLYHSHGTRGTREGYPEPKPSEGGRGRPIVVEEHDRRNGWGASWENGPRPSYPTERAPPKADYGPPPPPPPPAAVGHGRPPSNDAHAQHPSQGAQRPHNPRIYHHTPQTMSQVVNNAPAVTAEAALHHQSQQAHQQQQGHPPATSGPPGPPPTHYTQPPPRPQRTEKDKMLNGEPFLPFHPQLLAERDQCKGALYRLNNTSNNHLEITRDERDRHFRALVEARWTQHMYRSRETALTGSIGTQVYVDTPFYCDYGYNLHIGDFVSIGSQCRFLDSGRITIGRNCTIQCGVTIDTQKVPMDFKSLKGSRGAAVAADIHVGENVWIGTNATITAGVRIGTGAIIFPGAVVVRDVPRDVVVRGPHAEVRAVNWDD